MSGNYNKTIGLKTYGGKSEMFELRCVEDTNKISELRCTENLKGIPSARVL